MYGPISLFRGAGPALLALAVLGVAIGPAAAQTGSSYCVDGSVRAFELEGIGSLSYCVPLTWVDYELEPETVGDSLVLGFERTERPQRFQVEIELLLGPLYPKPDERSVRNALREIAPNIWRRRKTLQPRIESFDRGPLYGNYYRVQSAAETETPYIQHGTAAIRDLQLRYACNSEQFASEAHGVVRQIVKSIRYEGTRPIDPAVEDFKMTPGKARNVDKREIQDSLVAEWSFDEALGRTAFDTSGNGHAGLIEGAEWSIGARDGGLVFDGDSYVEVPDHADLGLETAGTLQAWARYSNEGLGGQILGKCLAGGTGVDCNYDLGLADPTFVSAAFCLGDTTEASCTDISSHGFDRMVWHQVVVSWDATLLRVYVDGRLKKLEWQTVTPAANEEPLLIGNGFVGRLDEVKIYDRALTAKEVASLYQRPQKD